MYQLARTTRGEGDFDGVLRQALAGQLELDLAAAPPAQRIGAIDVRIGICVRREAFAQRLAGHGEAIEVQDRLELAQQRAHAASSEEILHIAVADGLEVDQHGRRIGELVELIERNLHACAAGDCREVDDGVGRTAEREQHA